MVRFDHWGAANCGLQLGENLTGLYAARPPVRAARIGALINFIPPYVQAFWFLSSVAEAISAVSPSPSVRSDYELFYPTQCLRRLFSDVNRVEAGASR